MVRTQIYLDDNQRRALKMLAASKDQNFSHIVTPRDRPASR